MKIRLASSVGTGPTRLAAFHDALVCCGIGDYNIIRLSSVIPTGADIVEENFKPNAKEFGYRLYCVMSDNTESEPGKEVYSGIGWIFGKGKQYFVEHHGKSRKEVSTLIKKSLSIMMKPEEVIRTGEKIIGARCEKDPVCALVCAVYKSEPW